MLASNIERRSVQVSTRMGNLLAWSRVPIRVCDGLLCRRRARWQGRLEHAVSARG
jgi:hypothetical protein